MIFLPALCTHNDPAFQDHDVNTEQPVTFWSTHTGKIHVSLNVTNILVSLPLYIGMLFSHCFFIVVLLTYLICH